MVFHRSLSDSKSPRVFRTLLSILSVLSNAVIWLVSIRPPTSKSSRPFYNPWVIELKAPTTIGTIVTFMLQLEVLILLFTFFQFYSVVSWDSKVDNFANSLFFVIILLIRVFHISVSWWFFTGVWMTASLFKSPGLFSGFWPFLAMLSFE